MLSSVIKLLSFQLLSIGKQSFGLKHSINDFEYPSNQLPFIMCLYVNTVLNYRS